MPLFKVGKDKSLVFHLLVLSGVSSKEYMFLNIWKLEKLGMHVGAKQRKCFSIMIIKLLGAGGLAICFEFFHKAMFYLS